MAPLGEPSALLRPISAILSVGVRAVTAGCIVFETSNHQRDQAFPCTLPEGSTVPAAKGARTRCGTWTAGARSSAGGLLYCLAPLTPKSEGLSLSSFVKTSVGQKGPGISVSGALCLHHGGLCSRVNKTDGKRQEGKKATSSQMHSNILAGLQPSRLRIFLPATQASDEFHFGCCRRDSCFM